ncbi:MAG: amidase [Proteobacteria bacterium]|nr:amidase [Pseudomonadota bacterium]
MELIYKTAREMAADLAAKRISARELLNAHLARNDALAKKLNAVVATDIPRAVKTAEAIDNARAKGETLGLLAGLPMTVKDGFDVEGLPATSGNPAFAHRDAKCADADLVRLTRAQDAVIWGKTNVPFMLGDFQSFNAIYGTTNNPYDVTRVPGGSSGGAAAALAAGITPLEIGSDIGGSLRHPANFCGVCSLKPTWNVLPLRGHIPPAPDQYVEGDLGVGGPMARNVGDLRLLWNVLRGTTGGVKKDVKGARIAVWDEAEGFPLSQEVKEGVERAANALAQQGARVERVKSPVDPKRLMESYMWLLAPIIASGFPPKLLAQMESVRASDEKAIAAGADVWGPEFYRLASTARFYEVAQAQVTRQALKDQLAGFFKQHDAIVMPITPVTAFPHDHSEPFHARRVQVDNRVVPYFTMLSWISLATALHSPALALPAGQTKAGMPVGVQIVGPVNGEDRLFDIAAAAEEVLGGFRAPAV